MWTDPADDGVVRVGPPPNQHNISCLCSPNPSRARSRNRVHAIGSPAIDRKDHNDECLEWDNKNPNNPSYKNASAQYSPRKSVLTCQSIICFNAKAVFRMNLKRMGWTDPYNQHNTNTTVCRRLRYVHEPDDCYRCLHPAWAQLLTSRPSVHCQRLRPGKRVRDEIS